MCTAGEINHIIQTHFWNPLITRTLGTRVQKPNATVNNLANYWPVSHLPTLGKDTKKVLSGHLLQILDSSDFCDSNQLSYWLGYWVKALLAALLLLIVEEANDSFRHLRQLTMRFADLVKGTSRSGSDCFWVALLILTLPSLPSSKEQLWEVFALLEGLLFIVYLRLLAGIVSSLYRAEVLFVDVFTEGVVRRIVSFRI